MKRTFFVITMTALIWSCSHKSIPTATTTTPSSNSGSVVTTPATAGKTDPAMAATTTASTSATPEGSRTPATTSTTKSAEVQGQATYNAKCGKCHGLKATIDYTVDRWIGIMQVMAPKAHLDDTEKENVLAYVKANAKK